MNNNFNKENDDLVKYVLDTRFFKLFKEPVGTINKNIAQLELFVTSHCNLKCTYCYLNKYRDKLFPHAKNNELILSNLKILLEHFLEEGYSFENIDLFSGEVWGEELGNGVMDLLIEYIKRGVIIKNIMIPTNFTFILFDEKTSFMENYIEAFKLIGTNLQLSASIDGKCLEDTTRPFRASNGKTRDDEFYDKVFSFCKKYGYLFHPMVSAYGIEKWIDNYEWYKSMFIKHGFPPLDSAMLLEVRNDDWTDEAIDGYLKFLAHLIKDRYESVGSNITEFTKYLFNIDQRTMSGYLPYHLSLAENSMPCTIQTQLTVRLGDLALVPCHRMAYDNFLYGKYEVEDGKITGLTAINPQMTVKVLLTNPKNSIHGCDNCAYNKICMKGCFGAQFEFGEEPFMPLKTVCKLFKAKYDFLIDTYTEMGVFKEAEKIYNDSLEKIYLKDNIQIYKDVIERRESQCWY